MTGEQGTLPSDTDDPPTILKHDPLHILDGDTLAGWFGRIPERDCLGFVSEKGSDRRYKKLVEDEAHALNTEALDACNERGVERVLIAEPDTGDVYEYLLDDFRKWGDVVPESFLEYPSRERQKYVDRRDPWRVWKRHYSDLYSEPDDDTGGFQSASEVIDAQAQDDTDDTTADSAADSDDDDVPLEEKDRDELTDEERLELAYRRGQQDDS